MSTFCFLKNADPSASAVLSPERAGISYRELSDRIEQAAQTLCSRGVGRGQSVGIVLGNSPEFLIAFLGVLQTGAAAAPLNPAYTQEEFNFYLRETGCRTLITEDDAAEARRAGERLGVAQFRFDDFRLVRWADANRSSADIVTLGQHDASLLLHTSGTTSRPKLVGLSVENLAASISNISATYALTPEDVALLVMPLFHVHGLIGVALSTLWTGGTVVIPPRFSASQFWSLREKSGATWYSAVPTIHQVLLSRADQDGATAGPSGSFDRAARPWLRHCMGRWNHDWNLRWWKLTA